MEMLLCGLDQESGEVLWDIDLRRLSH